MLCIHKIIVTGCMSFFTAKAFLRRKCEVTSQFRRPNCASKSTPAWDQKGPRCNQRATAIFFPHFSAVFSGFLSILIPFLTSCARIPHVFRTCLWHFMWSKAKPRRSNPGGASSYSQNPAFPLDEQHENRAKANP